MSEGKAPAGRERRTAEVQDGTERFEEACIGEESSGNDCTARDSGARQVEEDAPLGREKKKWGTE